MPATAVGFLTRSGRLTTGSLTHVVVARSYQMGEPRFDVLEALAVFRAACDKRHGPACFALAESLPGQVRFVRPFPLDLIGAEAMPIEMVRAQQMIPAMHGPGSARSPRGRGACC